MNPCLLAEGPLPDIEDIVGPGNWPHLLQTLLWSGIILLFLTAIGVAVFVFLIKPRRESHRPSALSLAHRALRELESRMDSLTANEFSLKVSDALKDFFQARFHDPIRFETSEEFLNRFSSSAAFAFDRQGGTRTAIPVATGDQVAVFLRTCDEIKFGRRPDADQYKRPLLDQALGILASVQDETTVSQAKG